MASPQVEDGYTKIALELMEAFARYFPGNSEGQILWAIIRRTYGWNKKSDFISYQQLSDDTGLSRRTIIYSIQNLIAKNMITVIPQNHGTQLNLVSIQKDYDKWTPLANASPYQALLNNKKLKYAEDKLVAPVQTNNIATSELVAPVQTNGCTSANISVTPVQTNEKNAKLFAPTIDNKDIQKKYTKEQKEKEIKTETLKPFPQGLSQDVWDAFVEMRKKIHAPLTIRATNLIFSELDRLKIEGFAPNDIVNQSIMNCYRGVFRLKDKNTKVAGGVANSGGKWYAQ